MSFQKGIATGAFATAVLNVSSRSQQLDAEKKDGRPAHHLNDTQTEFCNPWDSFRTPLEPLSFAAAKLIPKMLFNHPPIPENVETLVKKQTPTWGLGEADPKKIKATWLGHACFLVELPAPEGAARGPRILFDPVFSHRCSPFTFMGPARYTAIPCALTDIPEVDIIVISHNHYDHLDTHTITTLHKSHSPHIFAPLGNGPYFKSIGIPEDQTHIMDWWEAKDVKLSLPSMTGAAAVENVFTVTCTPCQHMTGRGLRDRFKTLWSSWAVEGSEGQKVYFAGDTGYRSVPSPEMDETPDELAKLPVCPEFKRIGEKFGGFDLALIPIGAYNPRQFMSPVHCAPNDSVALFQDIRAKRAIGMHWGTWILTLEPLMDPPRVLAEECKKNGIPDGAFDVCGLGETVVV